MKFLFFIILLLLLTGCGKCQRYITHWTGDLMYKCSRSGVEYVQSDSGIAIHVDRNNNPIPCRYDY